MLSRREMVRAYLPAGGDRMNSTGNIQELRTIPEDDAKEKKE